MNGRVMVSVISLLGHCLPLSGHMFFLFSLKYTFHVCVSDFFILIKILIKPVYLNVVEIIRPYQKIKMLIKVNEERTVDLSLKLRY